MTHETMIEILDGVRKMPIGETENSFGIDALCEIVKALILEMGTTNE